MATQTLVPFYLVMALNFHGGSRFLLNQLAKGTSGYALWKQMYSNSVNVIGIFTQRYKITRQRKGTRRHPGVLSKWLVYQAFQAVVFLLLQALLLPLRTISISCNYAHYSRLGVSSISFVDSPLMNFSHFTEFHTCLLHLSCNLCMRIHVTFLPLRLFKGRDHVQFTFAHSSNDGNPYLLMYFLQVPRTPWTQLCL